MGKLRKKLQIPGMGKKRVAQNSFLEAKAPVPKSGEFKGK